MWMILNKPLHPFFKNVFAACCLTFSYEVGGNIDVIGIDKNLPLKAALFMDNRKGGESFAS